MKADLEMVATAVDALRVCGASRFHVELGHAGFFRDVAARMELEEGEMERMRALIEGKNFAALRDMLAPFRENPASAALLRLSRLFGGPEVLDEGLMERLYGVKVRRREILEPDGRFPVFLPGRPQADTD